MKIQAATLTLAVVLANGMAPAAFAVEPVRDLIDICTHATGQRSDVVKGFVNRGWLDVGRRLPTAFSGLLAEHALIISFVKPTYTVIDVDRQTGVPPDMSETVASVRRRLDGGELNVLWFEDGSPWLLLLYDDLSINQENRTDLYCLLAGPESDQATKIFDAFAEWNLTGQAVQFGPVKFAARTMQGYPPQEPNTGLLRFLEITGMLPERPKPEPQIDSGKSYISIFLVDAKKFNARYNRRPEASTVIWTRRAIENEVQP